MIDRCKSVPPVEHSGQSPTTTARPLFIRRLLAILCVLGSVVSIGAPAQGQETVVINITGVGGAAKYIREGDDGQKLVEVAVGQKVRWVNQGDARHTATSSRMDAAGHALFDTGDLPVGASKELLFDQAKFDAAGGIPGGAVVLEYYCDVHGIAMMRAELRFKSSAPPPPIVINISGPGGNGKYVAEGETEQKPVEVKAGQTVRWINQGDSQHTATSNANDANGQTVFDTSIIAPAAQKEILFDEKIFTAANVAPGAKVELDYHCRVYDTTMHGSLTLVSNQPAPAPTPVPVPTPVPGGGAGGAPQTFVIKAITESGSKWEPKTVQVKPGDTIAWRNISGGHGLKFQNWVKDRDLFEIQPAPGGALPFDASAGLNPQSALLDTTVDLLTVKVKAVPASGAPVDFGCTVHIPMVGQVIFGGAPETAAPPPPAAIFHPAVQTPVASLAAFREDIVDDDIKNSYYILTCDINGDGKPDLVTSGLGDPADPMKVPSEIAWYENPGWQKRIVARVPVAVPVAEADIDGDGHVDLAVGYNYGHCINDCELTNGKVGWLRNPGPYGGDKPWEMRPIGDLMATHRLYFGRFSQTEQLELLALPVVGGAKGKIHDPIKSTVFTRPADVLNAASWPRTVANDQLRVIHEAAIRKYAATENSPLDSAIIAGEEGITWVRRDASGQWQAVPLGAGEDQTNASKAQYKGCGSVDVGKFGGDPFAYIVTGEPLHGTTLSLYTKNVSSSLGKVTWTRRVLDVFGNPDPDSGEGPIHHVIAADFDGDGNDEFLVALRGYPPYQGVWYYKIIDLAKGEIVRQRISGDSAARIAVADFNGDGRLDFATVPYRVGSYFDSKDTHLMMFYNEIPPLQPVTGGK